MPGVQNKYSIDVNNRFFVEDEENDEEVEDLENVDPFEQLKQLNRQAEAAKNAPKPKVSFSKSCPYWLDILETGSKEEAGTGQGWGWEKGWESSRQATPWAT